MISYYADDNMTINFRQQTRIEAYNKIGVCMVNELYLIGHSITQK